MYRKSSVLGYDIACAEDAGSSRGANLAVTQNPVGVLE